MLGRFATFLLTISVGTFLVLAPTSSVEAAKQKYKYTGNKGCKCHLSPGVWEGDEWKQIDHSKSFKRLETPEEQKDPKCLKCHATGYGGKFKNPKLTYLKNVTCEACHGPGQGYVDVKNKLAKAVKNYPELKKKYKLKEKAKKAFNELAEKDPMMGRKVQYDAGLVVAGINNPSGKIRDQCLECHWEDADDPDKCPKCDKDEDGKPIFMDYDEYVKKDDHRDVDAIDAVIKKMSSGDKAKWKGYIERDPFLSTKIKPEAKKKKKKKKKAK
ncbi:MAG: multiheme c-type cytochrome [Candidatus Brocadiales bacterium]